MVAPASDPGLPGVPTPAVPLSAVCGSPCFTTGIMARESISLHRTDGMSRLAAGLGSQ